MIGAIMGLLIFCAVASWAVAAWSAITLVSLAPKGTGFSTYMDLGRWKHGKIAAAIGPAAAPHLARYRMAFAVFFGVIMLGIAMTFIGIAVSRNGGGA
jgi:hypothetical protein